MRFNAELNATDEPVVEGEGKRENAIFDAEARRRRGKRREAAGKSEPESAERM